jgi:ferric-dicitrate binding protein FerR (iron transport regulator)
MQVIKMEDLKNNLSELLHKSKWTAEEKLWLLKYLESSDTAELQELMRQQLDVDLLNPVQVDPDLSKEMLQVIHERIGVQNQVKKASVFRMWTLRIAAAASVIGLLVLGTFFWFNWDEQKEVAQKEVKATPYKNDVPPGGDKAILRLADGSTIVLDDVQNGILTQQGSTKVIKVGGKLAYDALNAGSKEIVYNTISTPRGGQYRVELPDGSQVWLNAASSIHFPTAFVGKDRRVEISGEAYFEVAENPFMPFIVRVNGAEVQVLGTHFNVMAYKEEAAVKTTLLEGSVRFVSGNSSNMLKPGQQSQLTKDGQVKVESGVDVDEVMAWKNGMFYFENADIETVMRQLSRWYDVEVDFKSKRAYDPLYAEIPRNTKLSDALKALELSGSAKFDIEGKKIVVTQ